MIGACAGKFDVQVLSQGREYPMLNEARRLAMPLTEYALIRQVQLLCDKNVWVFARTVIPTRSLTGSQRRLARLGQKPLGEVLFADKSMRRTPMEVAEIVPGQLLYRYATQHIGYRPSVIWGRRSVFYLKGNPLLVSEFFLPAMAGFGEHAWS
jgi:chorismate--pyruvate lyase